MGNDGRGLATICQKALCAIITLWVVIRGRGCLGWAEGHCLSLPKEQMRRGRKKEHSIVGKSGGDTFP